ncbi:MAG: hypothetical protein FK733_03125, partial [Asgard group archaeon]|nr:hypothetical protein [Asgard group archaeon]
KNKVLIVFALMIITMNIFALTQVTGFRDTEFESTLPTSVAETQPGNNDVLFTSQYNDTNLPSLSLWDLDINVTRFIQLNDFGYLTVKDFFTIQKNDNITMPIFRFALPKEWSSNLVHIEAKTMFDTVEVEDFNQTEVYVEYENDYYTFYAINLIPAITNDTIYQVRTHATLLRPDYYTTFYIQEGFMRNAIYVNFSLIPMIPAEIHVSKSNFAWDTESGTIEGTHFPANGTAGTGSITFLDILDVPAFNFTYQYSLDDTDYPYHGRIRFWMGKYPPTEALSYKRTVILENWYWARVSEEITVKSFGYKALTELNQYQWDLLNPQKYNTFTLQEFSVYVNDTENYRAYDELGALLPRSETLDLAQQNRVNIYLRSPLNGGDVKTVYLEYHLKLENILKYDKTEYLLETAGMPKCDFHVRNFELTVVFPQGSKFQYLTFGNDQVDYTIGSTTVFMRLGRRQTMTFSATNLTSFDNLELRASYYMSDLSYFIQPLILSLVIFVACLAYIGVRVLRKDVLDKVIISVEEDDEIPIDLIQTFVEKYEEKTALQTRITSLDENRRKKKVKQKEYETQRKILEAKMRELIKDLDMTKRHLKERGRKFFTIIQKIEVSEEKRTSIERSIQDLRIRYIREKQISKEAYLRILRDYQNQIEKFERDIDREIINLRLLIEHESKK